MNQRGFIFDFDGVVADTTEAHYVAWGRLCAENGWAFDRSLGDQLRGLTRRQCLRLILGGTLDLPESTIQAYLDRKNDYFLERANQMTEADVLPGVLPLMQQMCSAGYKIALGSASHNARHMAHLLGIAPYLDAISDPYTVVNGKPAPDTFLWAAGALGVNPKRCVVFEDASAGVQAALAGGFHVVGLGDPALVGNAHLVLPHLQHATLSQFEPFFASNS